ncbi:MAG: hypothetical protein K9I71_01105 [Ignavibacteriales bacterium]|nr:hypothetical protein [Ignavibacteriales bacterium]MCF8314685.1 hypothetical protein [Ignavibacteriales bacterium]MCF8436278.1 hypothetical protein [Ignavibacteriales bacterium]
MIMIMDIVMLGDSITAGFDTSDLFDYSLIRNYAVSGDSTRDLINRFNAEWFTSNPEYIFLCIGTNDIARNEKVRDIIINIRSIASNIKQLVPKGKIVLTSVFPVRNNEARPLKTIAELNTAIAKLAKDSDHFFFNLHPYFCDANGMLREEYTSDGLHLTKAAYDEWGKRLNIFLERNIEGKKWQN